MPTDDAGGHFGVITVDASLLDCSATAVAAIEEGERRRTAPVSTALAATGGAADDAPSVDARGTIAAYFCWYRYIYSSSKCMTTKGEQKCGWAQKSTNGMINTYTHNS